MSWDMIETLVSSHAGLLLMLAPGLPLLAAMALYAFRRAPVLPFAVLPVLPSLALLLAGRDVDGASYPVILLGLELGVDMVSRVFLLFTAVLWTVTGVYASRYLGEDRRRRRFFFFYLLCMSGNFGAVFSQDMAGFYMFFALMSIAAYGLVVHEGTPGALRAGKVYIVMAVIGEALVVMGLLLVAFAAGSTALAGAGKAVAASEYRDLMIALVLSGFGIKAGLVTLHVWLPLSYRAAPVPGSAVLSGAMTNVGLLGWIRFLPLGEASLPEWGWLCIAAGLFGAFFGVAVGMFQDDRKTILAYSSISQIGVMTAGVGIGLLRSEAWPVVLTAILIYSLHHALAKGALFLATGLSDALSRRALRVPVLIGISMPALALAGAPFTSGALAKTALKKSLVFMPPAAGAFTGFLLQAAAAATTVLMIRFVAVMAVEARTGEAKPAFWLLAPWAALTVFAALVLSPFGIRFLPVDAGALSAAAYSFYALQGALVPVAAGAVAYIAFIGLQRAGALRFAIPPGDVLELMVRLARLLIGLSKTVAGSVSKGPVISLPARGFADRWLKRLDGIEGKLINGTAGFILFLIVAAGLFFLSGGL